MALHLTYRRILADAVVIMLRSRLVCAWRCTNLELSARARTKMELAPLNCVTLPRRLTVGLFARPKSNSSDSDERYGVESKIESPRDALLWVSQSVSQTLNIPNPESQSCCAASGVCCMHCSAMLGEERRRRAAICSALIDRRVLSPTTRVVVCGTCTGT